MNFQPEYALDMVGKSLADVAMGRRPADTVIQNVKLVNVHTAEILPHVDIAIAMGRVALVGDAAHTIGEGTRVVKAGGLYAAPGFIDGHLHVESSMMTVREYAKAVLPHGTTSIFPDPHEIVSVLGMEGYDFMVEDAKGIPLRVYYTLPSCLPALPGIEDYGCEITGAETEALIGRGDVCALGEMMDFPGIVAGAEEPHRKVAATLRRGKPVTGHYAGGRLGRELNAYIASGVRCCHESVAMAETLAKVRLGMYAQIREGACSKDLAPCIKVVTEQKIDPRFISLVSDDCHPTDLVARGNMNHILRRAIEEGVNPITAIQMVTINTACAYAMEGELGSIAPGKLADIVLLSDLATVAVEGVFTGGVQVARAGALCVDLGQSDVPAHVLGSVRCRVPLHKGAFALAAPAGAGDTVRANIIGVAPGSFGTHKAAATLAVRDGLVAADPAQDIMKIAVIDRHRADGTMHTGLVQGFGIADGAIASTIGHDAHNMIIMGMTDRDMALAGNALAEVGGGLVVVQGGRIRALLPLPIAGLMSAAPGGEVAKAAAEIDAALVALGCRIPDPCFAISFLSLGVLPALRITNRGLFDTENGAFVPVLMA